MSQFTNQWQIDFVVLEGLGVVFLILAYQPLRNRIQESLRYLVSGHVAEDRDGVEQIFRRAFHPSSDSRKALAEWFAGRLRNVCDSGLPLSCFQMLLQRRVLFQPGMNRWI